MQRLSRLRIGRYGSATRALVVSVLGLAALFNLGLALVLIGHADETRYGEALIYDHAARLLRGEPLYQPLDQAPYTIVSYTPLYYWLVAAVRVAAGPGFLPGRLVSLGAALVTAGLVGWLVWRRTRAVWPALTASLLFVGLGLVGPVPWSAAHKEDVLAVALAVGSIVALVEGARTRTGIVAAALLAAAAILTKHSLVGPAIFGALWLLLSCSARRAALFAGVVLLSVLVPTLVLEATSGAFLANVVGGNSHQPFDWLTFEHNLAEFVTYQAAPALIAAWAVVRTRLRRDLLAMSWLGSLIPLVPLGAVGADYNYWLQFAAMSAVLAAWAVWEHRAEWLGVLGAALLGLNAAIALGSVGRVIVAHPEYVVSTDGDDATLARLVERVASTPGTVLADPLDVIVMADRPILLEPIVYSLREQDGSWDPRPMVERVCAGQIALLVLGYPIEEVGQRFPHSVAVALRQTFVLEQTLPLAGRMRYVLVPRPPGSAAMVLGSTDASGCAAPGGPG